MKKLLLYTVFFFVAVFGYGQNLVPNAGFEAGADSSAEGWSLWWDNSCSNPIPMNGPDYWQIVSGSPDRLLENDVFIACGYDNDMAESGKAWIEVILNEAGKAILLSPLKKDSIYKLSYFISWETFNGLGTSPNNLEFRFNNGGNVIASPLAASTNWTYFDTIFISAANSTEMEIWCVGSGQSGVKLDNISLNRDLSSGIFTLKDNAKTYLFPNPTSNVLRFNEFNGISKLQIYNLFGTLITEANYFSTEQVDVSSLSTGIYLIKLINNNRTYTQKITIIN